MPCLIQALLLLGRTVWALCGVLFNTGNEIDLGRWGDSLHELGGDREGNGWRGSRRYRFRGRRVLFAILGSASMTLTLFAEDHIKEGQEDAYHGAKADWIGFRRWMRLRVS